MKTGYTKAVDMWSIGCLTAVLLTGNTPFPSAEANSDFLEKIGRPPPKDAIYSLEELDNSHEWDDISHDCKDFVRKLLVVDETARMTAQEALNHPWFASTDGDCRELHDAVYRKAIRDWKPRSLPGVIIEEIRLLRPVQLSTPKVS